MNLLADIALDSLDSAHGKVNFQIAALLVRADIDQAFPCTCRLNPDAPCR